MTAFPIFHEMTKPAGRRGWLLLLLGVAALLGACGQGAVAAGPYPRFAEYAGREVIDVRFAGDLRLPVDSLRAVTMTRPSECRLLFLPICIPGTNIGRQVRLLDLTNLAGDVARLQLYYRDHGYYATRVVPDVDPVPPDRVAVRFAIVPGDQTFLNELLITGTEEIVPVEALRRRIPLRENEPFRRIHFLASEDTIRGELLRRGYANAIVLRNYSIDAVAGQVTVEYEAIPGPLVRVDSVVIVGNHRLEERTVRGMLTFGETDLLRATELNNSQRNLYGLGMVNFASVEVAPDTLQRAPEEDSLATVLVRVVEAPQYLVDATAGYGTVDCFRSGVSWTDRNFLGDARRLEISGSVAKVGVGWPANAGFERNLCPALAGDEFSDTLNYRLGAEFQQPRLFGTRNRLGVGLRTMRHSELGAYVRRATGGQIAVARDLTPRTLLSTTTDIERGATRAPPAVFCVAFDICEPQLYGTLQLPRWSNAWSANLIHDRTFTDGVAVRGWAARGGLGWAAQAFGSDDEFLRLNAEVLGHRPLGPGYVLAARVQAGSFLHGTLDPRRAFIPPDRRFYAGGPNSVRGFGRNALGPIVYVAQPPVQQDIETGVPGDGRWLITEQGDTVVRNARPSATGGTDMVVASLELRTPSPIFSQYMRLGFFVDAGQVWERTGDARLTGLLATPPVMLTPGVGVRFITPVGPIRVDAAYNPHGVQPGQLFLLDEEGNLRQRSRGFPNPEFEVERAVGQRFRDRIQIHFAVGHAF